MKHAAVLGVAMLLFMGTVHHLGHPHRYRAWDPALTERQPTLGRPENRVRRLAVDRSQEVISKKGTALRGIGPVPTWAAIHDALQRSVTHVTTALNPLAGLTPFSGMWLNCIFGGVGVGLINLLVYLIVAVFLSGLMVGGRPSTWAEVRHAR